MEAYRDRPAWYASLSSYWFASSFTWFVLLTVVLPKQVAQVAPEGTKNTAWGMVFAFGAAWATIGPSLFGALSDRRGNRSTFLAVGAALTVAAVGCLCFARSLWQIAGGYLLLQVADDVATGPYGALIPQYVPENRRGRASGIMNLLSLGGQISAALVSFLSGGRPIVVYVAIGITTLVCATLAVHTIRPLEDHPVPVPSRPFIQDFLRGWVAPWRNRDFFLVWFARFMFALGLYLVQPYLRNYLEDVVQQFQVLGLRISQVDQATTALVLVITLCAAAGASLGGGWSDQFGRKRIVLMGGGIMATTLIPFLLLPRYDLLLALAALFGIGYGLYLSAEWALASDLMPNQDALGRDMGIWQMSVSVVQIFAGSAGRLVDWGNQRSLGLGYQIAFGLGTVALSLGIVTVRLIRRAR